MIDGVAMPEMNGLNATIGAGVAPPLVKAFAFSRFGLFILSALVLDSNDETIAI